MSFRVFIVEDDEWYGEVLKYHLSLNPEFEVFLFETAKECISNLHLKPNAVSIDFQLPDMNGEQLMEKIHAYNQSIPVIITSGQKDITVALNLLKKGASDYFIKDDSTKDLLWNSLIKIQKNNELEEKVESLTDQLESKHDFEKSIIGQSSEIKKSFKLIEKAINSNINVSITGETGTGKEVVAKAIHYNSERKKKPFVAVNMAAIPTELVESELFGHEKGSFTGAVNQKIGKFEEANGGTLFLDEIAEMDLNLQSKLLRAIQEREIIRVGGNDVVKVNIRLIVSTHKNLAEEVKNGNFREDLFYRVIGLPIELPPLRNRGNDVLILAKHFIDLYAKENKVKPPILSPEAKEKLLKNHFAGNVRELKAVIDLACVMYEGDKITPDDLTFSNFKEPALNLNLNKTLKEFTNDLIQFYLDSNNKNVLVVAKKLNIAKSKIYNLINSGDLKI
ncbi:MAG: sigma-54 dependent transcriptional regulator [Fluviicola sp.]|nr:sigma-54 dependent transcriptional regulator [Fluviicola sp.]